jgi:hypothetical protein
MSRDIGAPAFEVPPIPASMDAGDGRSRKAMSRPARLAAIAAREALSGHPREAREGIGYFLGVGASGGPVGEMLAMLRPSLDEHDEVSLTRLGEQGLAASNPLFTFHVLNNFTLCHGAILEGTQGPSAAIFSRGGGTVRALAEAAAAIGDGDCDRALAGGADTALHTVTWSELGRDRFVERGLVPAEGAALILLARDGDAPICSLERATLVPAQRRALGEALAEAPRIEADHVILAPWGEPARASLARFAAEASPGAEVLDVTRALGDSLAATPALAWACAIDAIASGASRRAVVLSAGIDGDLGVVSFTKEREA